MLQQTEGLDERTRQKADFYFRQLSSAFSPSNFPMTNPEVVRETLATNAQNLVQGMAHLVNDMERSGDLLKISQTDTAAFEVGKNLAVTPGKIVFQNDIFQLIQYAPTTDKVHEVPLLVVPPWINKFYILDLTPTKSFLKFAVDQGFTVFVVSWVNPDERLSHKSFEDYMVEGVLTASDAVRRETGLEKINVLGYCVGGTLVGSTLAYLAARGEAPFRSATFLTTQVDFSKAGDLLLFTNDAQLASLEEMMAERGYLDGSRMASVFNMMRPRDLIWPYIVNNYMLGKKPFPFDLLFWNQDSTRMPAANHNFYLREFYNENRLAKGQMTLAGVKLDLKKVKLPIYELATREDHIAPCEVGLHRLEAVRRPGRVRACRQRTHRRRRQPARQGQVPVLDRGQGRGRHARGMDEHGQGAPGLLVAALGPVARQAFGCLDRAARAGREPRRHRECARELRQGQVVAASLTPPSAGPRECPTPR